MQRSAREGELHLIPTCIFLIVQRLYLLIITRVANKVIKNNWVRFVCVEIY